MTKGIEQAYGVQKRREELLHRRPPSKTRLKTSFTWLAELGFEENEEMLVWDRILGHEHKIVRTGKVLQRYLVKFYNYLDKDARWMQEPQLKSWKTLLQEYKDFYILNWSILMEVFFLSMRSYVSYVLHFMFENFLTWFWSLKFLLELYFYEGYV